MTIQEFIDSRKDDFDTYEARPDWNGYKVFEVWRKKDEGACVGYPQYALLKNDNIRESSFEETVKIMQSYQDSDDDEE
jgi:hypothetical protein